LTFTRASRGSARREWFLISKSTKTARSILLRRPHPFAFL
jgi:hypothetical protein